MGFLRKYANIQMDTNDTNKNTKIIHKELSYIISGILFKVHNELGRFCRERQYTDTIELLLKDSKINYVRENKTSLNNVPDFVIDNKIILEIKAAPFVLREHFNQTQGYLQDTNIKLGLLVNFRSKYLKPIRIIRID
ncbi:MAG: GxxExxY protein [Patescibacteria group bacterium]